MGDEWKAPETPQTSKHCGIKGLSWATNEGPPEITQTSKLYGIEGLSGALNWTP